MILVEKYKSYYMEVSQSEINSKISDMEEAGWVLHNISAIYSGPKIERQLGLFFRQYEDDKKEN